MLSISGLDVAYGQSQVLWGVDLEVQAGELVCLMGRNGVGKTTLLKTAIGTVVVITIETATITNTFPNMDQTGTVVTTMTGTGTTRMTAILVTAKAILTRPTSTLTVAGWDTIGIAMIAATISIIPGSTAALSADLVPGTYGSWLVDALTGSGLTATTSRWPQLSTDIATTGIGTATGW